MAGVEEGSPLVGVSEIVCVRVCAGAGETDDAAVLPALDATHA